MNHLINRLINQASISVGRYRHFSRCSILHLGEQQNAGDGDDQHDDVKKNSKLYKAKSLLPEQYKIFDDDDNEIIYENILDLDSILNQKQARTKHIVNKSSYTNLRGKKGVFDIEELIVLLKDENMKDIATIHVPKELKYCQYMVMCNATSTRHIKVIYFLVYLFYFPLFYFSYGSL